MAVLPVLRYPSRILKQVAPSGPARPDAQLATDLIDTMRASPGCIGLAAPQVGVATRAFAIDLSVLRRPVPTHGLGGLFEPEVLVAEGVEVKREGCMSVPDFTCDVRRAATLVVRGTDATGRVRVLETSGLEARAVQHEVDHLDGLLILDRVASVRTDVHPRRRYAAPGEHLR